MRGRDIKTGRFSDNGSVPADDVLREKLDRLAVRVASQMLGETDRDDPDRRPLSVDEVAMFKAVANYYTATRRLPAAKVDDDDGEGFSGIKERIHAGSDETSADS